MTSEERVATEKMKAEQAALRENFFSLAISIERATPVQMAEMGFSMKTKDQAIAIYFRDYVKRIDKLFKEHLKKYPD